MRTHGPRLFFTIALVSAALVRADINPAFGSPAAAATGFAKALFADGPDAKLAGALALFGQFVGNWDVDVLNHLPDGTTQTIKGEWHFGWILDGRAIQDVWMVPTRAARDEGAPLAGYGTTLRFYDPKLGAWRVIWASVSYRNFIAFTARPVGDEIVMEADNARRPLRWIFSNVTPRSFRWRAVESSDGWKTEAVQQEMTARRADARNSLSESLLAPGPASGFEDENRLFGQLVGDWTIGHEGFRPDGTIGETEGTLNVGWILDGRAVQDVWRFKNNRTGEFIGGTTLRLYDPKLDAWHSIWFYPVAGVVQTFIARHIHDEIVLDGSTPTGLPEQWIFSKVTPASFDWRAIESSDNRASWRLTEHMRIRRAAAPPGSSR